MVSAAKVEGEYSFLSKNSPLDQSEGVKTYLYHLGAKYGNNDLNSVASPEQGPSLLDTILLSQWDNFSWKGHMDYDVTACQLKVIEGARNFVGQLNNKWNSFSLKEYGKFFESFGCLKPNRMKSYEGLLLCIAQGEEDRPEVAPSVSLPKDGLLLIANAYPVEYGHIFLVPSAISQLSCSWDKRMFVLATKIASEVNNAAFRVSFDSGTSVESERLFFQACYFANPLPVESASTVAVYDGKVTSDIIVSEMVDYPLKALVFTSNNLKTLVNVVSEICCSLHDNATAYSLLISNNSTKVFLFPQVQNLATGCSLTAWQCGGYFVYHTKSEFDSASETEISKRMASASLQDGSFEYLKHLCCAIANDLVY